MTDAEFEDFIRERGKVEEENIKAAKLFLRQHVLDGLLRLPKDGSETARQLGPHVKAMCMDCGASLAEVLTQNEETAMVIALAYATYVSPVFASVADIAYSIGYNDGLAGANEQSEDCAAIAEGFRREDRQKRLLQELGDILKAAGRG